MAHISADRVKETTTTTGTGAVTLAGAVAGFQAFSAVCANADTCWYAIVGQTTTEWELGLGTWATGGTLTRTTVLKSSNANAVVTLSAGTKDVFITIPADNVLQKDKDGACDFTAGSTDPAAAAAGHLKLYAKNIGSRIMPKWIGPSGIDTPFQPFLGMNTCRSITTGTGTTVALLVATYSIGTVCIAGGTNVQTIPATGSLKSRTRLSAFATAATAGTIASLKGLVLEAGRETGFFFVERFCLDTIITTNLGFWGLYASVTAPAATIDFVTSTAVAKLGLAINASTGNWKLVECSGSAVTATDLGASFPVNTTDLMELVMFCVPTGTSIGYRVTNLTTGAVTSGTMNTNIPGATVYMTPLLELSNNAAASIVKWSLKSVYLETDY